VLSLKKNGVTTLFFYPRRKTTMTLKGFWVNDHICQQENKYGSQVPILSERYLFSI
jgi:hypothetical protein